ncbi:MAG: rhomboid family intramembrane serine protease [Pseudarcicella sp.]|nr:rhomboid family intramembrane serine protease [Pseudarcicella sp.]
MSLTIIILIVTVGISILAFSNPSVLSKAIFNPYIITRNKEYYRFISSGFIHADFMHLFFNMFTFYSFGRVIESMYGQLYFDKTYLTFAFLGLYIGGIIVSDLPTYFKNKNVFKYNSLGASGGVSSVLFAAILYFPTQNIYVYGIPIPAIVYAILYTWYTVYMDNRGGDNVNHSAHLYGAIWGVIYTTLIYPSVWLSFFENIKVWFV